MKIHKILNVFSSVFLLSLTLLVSVSAADFTMKRPMERITKMKVMEVNDNAGKIWGIRLNEHVNREINPLAYDAELDCRSFPGPGFHAVIRLLDVYDYDANEYYLFTEFGFNYSSCESIRKQIIKNYDNNQTSCLYYKNPLDHTPSITTDESICDEN